MKPLSILHALMRAARCGMAAALVCGSVAQADPVTDWNTRTGEIVTASGLGTPPANRVMALVHTAAYEAANAISRRYPSAATLPAAPPGASVEAAIAAAPRAMLLQQVPSQRAAIEAAYQQAMARVDAAGGRDAGVAVGEQAAAALLARRANDRIAPDTYRPHAAPGVYVPTVFPAASQWSQRAPWLMASPAQFRPPAPPALTSERWARDYNEVKVLGARNSTARTKDQTELALFWEATLPPIYHGMVQCVTMMPGRDLTRNARLYAAITQAIDDAMIALFEAKYHYAFWRPVTAIRNGDIDGNDATEPDRSWTPLIDTPMHPEYPCAHCVLSATVATVLKAELGSSTAPGWTTTSSSAKGAARRWIDLDAFVDEVANARVYDGVHYRFSTEVGTALGRQVGQLAAARLLREP
jgi:hypothetical protein